MLPRGIRNNNPLNIRIGNRWQGEVENPSDPDFEQFVSLEYGLRAAFILLRRYIQRYHLLTITDVIHRWAPSTENNTQSYIGQVSKFSGIGALDKLEFSNRQQMVRLVCAMARVENGICLDAQDVDDAYMKLLWSTNK